MVNNLKASKGKTGGSWLGNVWLNLTTDIIYRLKHY